MCKLCAGQDYLASTKALLMRAQIQRHGLIMGLGAKGGKKGKASQALQAPAFMPMGGELGSMGSDLMEAPPGMMLDDDDDDEDQSAEASLDFEDLPVEDGQGQVDAESLPQVRDILDRGA